QYQYIKDVYLQKQVIGVRGNCDWSSTLPATEVAEVGGKRIFITHGHMYQAKFTTMNMIYAAREEKANILLFGHTHQAMTDYNDGLYIMNPGSCSGYYATYGVIDITPKGDIVTNIVRLSR
ncbi:MAG: YfcE family phosphodiesterase, partial [Ruminococcus sp.]|nr:YfcE family phosphodiesterase [Ruminococcus sp.]